MHPFKHPPQSPFPFPQLPPVPRSLALPCLALPCVRSLPRLSFAWLHILHILLFAAAAAVCLLRIFLFLWPQRYVRNLALSSATLP